MRYLALIIATCALAGCAREVVMLNPLTGQTVTCPDRSLNPYANPWSQEDSCVGDYIAQGWRPLERR